MPSDNPAVPRAAPRMRSFALAAAFAMALTACGSLKGDAALESTDATDAPSELAASDVTTPTTKPSATAAPAVTLEDIVFSLTDPVPADNPDDIRLREEGLQVDVVSLVADRGTPGELPITVAVPNDWDFDAELGGFTDGSSTMMFNTDCGGPCEAKTWTGELNSDDGPFASFSVPSDVQLGFGSSLGSEGGSEKRAYEADDGSASAMVVHYNFDAARYLSCTVHLAAGSNPDLTGAYEELCTRLQIDWTILAANSPVPTFEPTLTDEMAALVANPSRGQPVQKVALDNDNNAEIVSIELPASATWSADTLGTISLGDDYSVFTHMELDTTCDGECGAQDWEAKLTGLGGPIARQRAAIDVRDDSPIPSGWIMWGDTSDEGVVGSVYRWNAEAQTYFVCNLDIDNADTDQALELVAHCLTAQPDWDTLVLHPPIRGFEPTLSDEMAAVIANPSQRLPVQRVALDDDENPEMVTIELPASATWSVGPIFSEIWPGRDFSTLTDLRLYTTCGGICGPQNWEAKLTGLGGPIAQRRASIEVWDDSPIPSGWIIWGTTKDGGVAGSVYRWNKDADKYFVCRVGMNDRDADRATELIAMCLSAQPDWIDL